MFYFSVHNIRTHLKTFVVDLFIKNIIMWNIGHVLY